MAKETVEIRWHARGGQGAVTASKILAETALEEGKYFQGMPDYGAERMGAPVKAYTRISSVPIKPYCQVTEPDVVIILDSTLIGVVDLTEGLKKDGVILVNTDKSVSELQSIFTNEFKIYAVDATAISMEELGRNLPNTPMLGALSRATGIVGKESLAKLIEERLGATMKESVVKANLVAFERAYTDTRN